MLSARSRRARELVKDGLADFFGAMALLTFGGPASIRFAQRRLYRSAWTPSDVPTRPLDTKWRALVHSRGLRSKGPCGSHEKAVKKAEGHRLESPGRSGKLPGLSPF